MNDEERMNKIKWRRANNGLYFQTYETKEEAWEKFKELARRYRHGNYTVKELCEEYQDKGIMFYPTQTGRWLTDVMNIEVKYKGYSIDTDKRATYLSLDKALLDIREALSDKLGSSHLVNNWYNLWFRISFNLPINEVFTFVKDEYGQTLVGFLKWKGEIRSVYRGKITEGSKKLLESLCSDAEQYGWEYLKRKCQTLGFYTMGANNEED